ncbi:MAG: 16S rRNA (cytidine(1402)-2'-O)-methyltransferase [Cytophagales bacterium]|nr:16S rRNA (cytidine(1402)-2'-O)-methyltransferase [Cytophagales bacterium]
MPLTLVPTPIGNLEDMTYRAVNVLKYCHTILCEDTRTSSVLLKHYDIHKPLMSYHAFNEHKILNNIIEKLKKNEHLCLITDAGTPGISDPGFLLVRECIKNNISVECLPGATAFVPALAKSGLPCDRFVFEGFIPVKKGRTTLLKTLANEARTLIFYESPHKLLKTLNDFNTYFGAERPCAVSREISKKFEETYNGTIAEALAYFTQKEGKGEFVIIIQGKNS